ncbi:MAG: hypothetical protein CL849_04010 [Crocinitomicaceae bacterium]|nr:hypothetical protein [Crocinitomicaceae bacterium]
MGIEGNPRRPEGGTMSLGRIAVLVSNDLAFDQRVRKTCASLQRAGYEPILIGRRMVWTDPVSIERPYRTERLWLRVHRGPLFYLVLQVRMWWALKALSQEGGVTAVWANDLDTLGPAVWASRRFGWSIAYDSHEWFTEAEGLKGRPLRKWFWTIWERRCFARIDRMITVNESIADAYAQKGLQVEVVSNVPERMASANPMPREELGWPVGKTVLLMQGAYMDRDRGALDAVRSMLHLPGIHLALIGAGPEHAEAASLATRIGVADRVHVHERMPYDTLRRCTAAADVGLSLDRPTVDNFRFSLPNKLFDFLHAGLPVVCSDLPVAGRFVKENGAGEVASGGQDDASIARHIADAVQAVLNAPPDADHLADVASRHHWGVHEEVLLRAIHRPS